MKDTCGGCGFLCHKAPGALLMQSSDTSCSFWTEAQFYSTKLIDESGKENNVRQLLKIQKRVNTAFSRLLLIVIVYAFHFDRCQAGRLF